MTINFNYDESLLNQTFNVECRIVDENEQLIEALSSKVNLTNPYEIDLKQFLPNTTPLTLNEFFATASNLINDSQKRSGIIENKIVKLVEEYPPETMDTYGDEVITFKVVSRKPAMMNRNATARPVRESTFSHQGYSPSEPNKIITVESRPVDHIVEFTCWAKNNKLANDRVVWLEKLLINNAFVFKIKGAERFYWEARMTDTYMTVGGQRLFYRPLQFFLRFREFDIKAESILRELLIDISKK
jgi:hypothetical protein